MAEPILFIQIPCYNEGETIGVTLDALPRSIPGVARIRTLIIDDGSTDDTVEVARRHGVDHVVQFRRNRGLARAFAAGIDACLAHGADIIVNTDGDNQYCAGDIPKLLEPILAEQADIVIGARPIDDIEHFSPVKKALQRLGSRVVRQVSGTEVEDAPSGFRALTRAAAEQLHVFGDYTYTIETIIQAGQKGFEIVSVPIRVNADLRPSRLVKSIPGYVMRSVATMGRIYLIYQPLRLFVPVTAVAFTAGFALGGRYLVLVAMGEGEGHVQSVILCALLLTSSVMTALVGVVADLIATNRKLLERLDARLQRIRPSSTPTATREMTRPEMKALPESVLADAGEADPVDEPAAKPRLPTMTE